MEYLIVLTWDEEAGVWIAESEDLPGLILESPSLDALIERTKTAAQELLEISRQTHHDIHLRFSMERQAVVA
jgi:predicted RNase H-like HicB family nuclease